MSSSSSSSSSAAAASASVPLPAEASAAATSAAAATTTTSSSGAIYRRVSMNDGTELVATGGVGSAAGGSTPNPPPQPARSGSNAAPPTPSQAFANSRTRSERLADKFYAFLWVVAAVVVIQCTNFFHVLLSDEDGNGEPRRHVINRPVFNFAMVLLGVNTVLLLYLVLYLPLFKNIRSTEAWDVYCPRVVPIMTALGILIGILLIRATWPLWGFLSPLILGVVALGGLFSLHFVPWCL